MDVRFPVFTLLFLVLATTPAHADTYRFASIPPALPETLECGTNEFPPFTYADANGHAAGIEVDVVREAARRLGLKVNISVLPWPRLIASMRAGALDCMFAAFITPERLGYMNFTRVPLHVSRLALYSHRTSAFSFERIEDLRGKRIGTLRDFRTVDVLDEALNQGTFAERVYGNDFDQLFEMLAQKRVDVVIVNDQVARAVLRKRQDDAIIEQPVALSSNAAFLTFSRHRNFDNMVAKMDYALFEIVADGTYARYFAQHIKALSP